MYLRPLDVAKKLEISKTVIYDLLKKRQIRHVRIGGSIRIPVDAIDEYVQSRIVTPVTHTPPVGRPPANKHRRKLIQKHLA